MLTVLEYYALARPQLAGLSGDALLNAERSMLANAPTAVAAGTSGIFAVVDDTQPHFVTDPDTGIPTLIHPKPLPPAVPPPSPPGSVPPAGPPAGTTVTTTPPATQPPVQNVAPPPGQTITVPAGSPCPPGYVTSPGGTPATTPTVKTLADQVASAFTASGISTKSEAAPCNIQCQVAAPQMVTDSDYLHVFAASTFNGTANLQVTTRVLDCSGQINTYSGAIKLTYIGGSGNAVSSGTLCMQLAPGCLLSVMVSGAPSCTHPGEIWVQAVIKQGGCQGTPSVPLFSDYITDESFKGWPGGRQANWTEGPGADYVGVVTADVGFSPVTGTIALVKSVSVVLNTDATAGNRDVYITWQPVNTATAHYIGSAQTQGPSKAFAWTYAPGLQPGLFNNFIVQVPLPDQMFMDPFGNLSFIIDNQGSGDVLSGSVCYKSWAEPPTSTDTP